MHKFDGTEKQKQDYGNMYKIFIEIKQAQYDLKRPKGKKQLNVS